jgi:hypothetical protein
MMLKKAEISEKERTDIRTLMRFVAIYCREHHNGEKTPFSFRNLGIKEIEKKGKFLMAPKTQARPGLWLWLSLS